MRVGAGWDGMGVTMPCPQPAGADGGGGGLWAAAGLWAVIAGGAFLVRDKRRGTREAVELIDR